MDNANNVESLSSQRGVADDIHSGLTEDQVMLRTFIAMCIPAILAVIAMGTNALFNILTAVATAVIAHYILRAVELKSISKLKEVTYQSVYSPLVAGMIVGLCMGELSPYPVTAAVSLLTMVVFKWGQEKYFGRKIVNPAAGAKAIFLLLLTLIWAFPDSLAAGMIFYPEHLMFPLYTESGFIGAMEFAESWGVYGTENLSISQSLFLWKSHGWIGGASGLGTLIAGVLLAFWIKLKWRISVMYLVTMAVLAVIIGYFTGGHYIMRIAFHAFTGSVIFLAFFMATEPQTTPVTKKGQYIFAVILGFLTMGLQMAGLFGSSFIALAIINPFARYMDQIGLEKPFGKENRVSSPSRGLSGGEEDSSSAVINYDPSKCIVCTRCIKACQEIQGKGVLGYGARSRNIYITAGIGQIGSSECDACGECIQYCPTGALREKFPSTPLRKWETKTVRTTCSYCGVGCQLDLFIKEDEISRIQGVDTAPNYGSLCIRGRFGYNYLYDKKRIKQPLLRRRADLEPVSWNEALNEVASKLKSVIKEEGGEAVAGFSSAENTNEENYLFQKFMRAAVGTNNIDYSSRLYHSASDSGLEAVFPYGAATNSLEELEKSDCILLISSDISESHPVAANYIKRAVLNNNADLIIIDPRRIDMARLAKKHLTPKVGTDTVWIDGLMKIIIDKGLEDKEFIEQRVDKFSVLKESLADYSLEKAAKKSGIAINDLEELAEVFANAETASIVYGAGLTQHAGGTESVISLANLAMLTGNIGRKSTGIYPLKVQNNSQGASDMGVRPNFLPGYQQIGSTSVRKKFENKWNCKLPAEKGFNAVRIIEKINEGKVKALIVMGDNPIFTGSMLPEVENALEKLEYLLVINPIYNRAAEIADVVLPGTAFAEKEGTFTNTARRISKANKAVNPPGKSKAEWEILSALASKMGYQMNYKEESEIMNEIAELAPIYEGVNYQRLAKNSLQWPINKESDLEEDIILYKDSFAGEKARFYPLEQAAEVKKADSNFPYYLLSDRILYYFHTGSLSHKSESLKNFVEDPYIAISPEDAKREDFGEGDIVNVRTHRGEFKLETKISEKIKKGSVFIPFDFLPFHFSELKVDIFEKYNLDIPISVPQLNVSVCQVEKISENSFYNSGGDE